MGAGSIAARAAVLLLLAGGAAAPAWQAGAAAPSPDTPAIADFMVMQVCVDAQDKEIPGLTPLSPGCTHHRPIRDGENLPYHLAGWNPPPEPCSRHLQIHDNVAMTRGGVTRTVSVVRVGYDACDDARVPVPAYYEVHWFDEDYGFMMGAWARGHGEPQGIVGGAVTPACDRDPNTSLRFYRFWVLSSRIVPAPGRSGYAVFTHRSYNSGLPPLGAPCPTRYPSRYLAIWSRGNFTFRSGATLDTVISHPYSQADRTGTSPGNARQMERTYWTRELGQTRWEGWKRDDFVYKNGKTAAAVAQESFNKGACSKPFEMPRQPTPGMVFGAVAAAGAYSQPVTDLNSGERHVWYLAECLDMTNLIIAKKPGGDPFPPRDGLPSQFWDFWAPSAEATRAAR